jgi:hypothetical protein
MNNMTERAISLKEILNSYPTLEKLSSFKGYKGKLYKFLIDSICWDDMELEQEPNTIKDKLQFLADTCFDEYCLHDANYKKRYGSFSNAFKEWLQGCPSVINIPIYYCEIIEFAKEIGSISQNPSDKLIDKVCENYYNFMTANIFQLFDKYEVKSKF